MARRDTSLRSLLPVEISASEKKIWKSRDQKLTFQILMEDFLFQLTALGFKQIGGARGHYHDARASLVTMAIKLCQRAAIKGFFVRTHNHGHFRFQFTNYKKYCCNFFFQSIIVFSLLHIVLHFFTCFCNEVRIFRADAFTELKLLHLNNGRVEECACGKSQRLNHNLINDR